MEEQSMLNISITWRGKQLNVEINSNSSCKEFGQKLQKLTNVRPETMRLLVPRSRDKGSKLLTPFSDEHSSLSLREASVVEGRPIRMMGVFEEEIEEVSLNSMKPDPRIAGFDEEEKRLRQRLLPGPQTSLKLPQGTYIFCEFHTLEIPGIELNPPASEALKRMHRLASDPGVIAIMNKHQWRVGIMTEMAPVGYVGISPKCILGFNKNHGEEISLRLRTDDLKGFRKYESIKKTLLHELAHMVYSEHDADFYALDRQLNQEAASLDWTKSRRHTLSGLRRTYHHEEEDFHVGTVSTAKKLGGQPVNSYTSARSSSVAAAYQRLLSASVTTSKSEPDQDDSQLKENVHTMIPMEIVRMPNCESSSYRGSDEPDPDDRVEQENMVEPDPDDRVEQENMVEPDPDDRVEQESMVEPDPDDRVEKENIVEPDPDDRVEEENMVELDPDDQVYHVNTVEPDPDDQVVHEKKVEPDTDISGVVEVIMQEKNLLELGENEFPVKTHEEVDPEFCRLKEAILADRNTEEPDPDDSQTAESSQLEPDPDDAKEAAPSNVGSAVSDGSLTSNNPELQRIQDPVADICMRLQKAIQMLRSEVTPMDAALALQTLTKIIRNVIEHPDEMKFRRLRKANPLFQRNLLNYKAAMEVLSIVGFHEDVMSDDIGRTETYMVLRRNDPGLLWLAKSSLETCTA